MNKPSSLPSSVARWLLANETNADADADAGVAAAGRVLHKIFDHLASLVGTEGARALFARSVRLTASDFPPLGRINRGPGRIESSVEQIVSCLRGESPDVVAASTVALCTTLLALLDTLIGEKLTMVVLKKAWPEIDVVAAKASKEETKS